MQYEFGLSNRICYAATDLHCDALPIDWKRIPCRCVINTLWDVMRFTDPLPYLTQNTSNSIGRKIRGDKVQGMDT